MEKTSGFVRTERDMADHLDNGVVGLHWVAADGTILWANRAYYEPLGYTREEWVGHHATEFHADHAALGDMFQRLSKGETIYNYPARLRHKNGSRGTIMGAPCCRHRGGAPRSGGWWRGVPLPSPASRQHSRGELAQHESVGLLVRLRCRHHPRGCKQTAHPPAGGMANHLT